VPPALVVRVGMDFVETQEITPFELKSMKSSKQGLEGSSKQELFDFFPVHRY
jgi:hypothetical protein